MKIDILAIIRANLAASAEVDGTRERGLAAIAGESFYPRNANAPIFRGANSNKVPMSVYRGVERPWRFSDSR